MRSFLVFILMISNAALSVAQDVPKLELGAGFSFAQTHTPNVLGRSNLNGIQFDATYNVNRVLGAKAEFTGHLKCLSGCYWDESTARQKAFTFVAGPRFAARSSSRFFPWGHVLVGVSNISYSDDFGQDIATTDWAIVAGGGLDVDLGPFSIRPIQADLFRHRILDAYRNDFRLGVAWVLNLGKHQEKESAN